MLRKERNPIDQVILYTIFGSLIQNDWLIGFFSVQHLFLVTGKVNTADDHEKEWFGKYLNALVFFPNISNSNLL